MGDFTIQMRIDAVGDGAPASGLLPENHHQYEFNAIGLSTQLDGDIDERRQGGPTFMMASGEVLPDGFERLLYMPGGLARET